MTFKISKVTVDQWEKVAKSLYYSFSSGFIVGFLLAFTGGLSALVSRSGSVGFDQSLLVALVSGGLTGGINSLAVTVKQLFTPTE